MFIEYFVCSHATRFISYDLRIILNAQIRFNLIFSFLYTQYEQKFI